MVDDASPQSTVNLLEELVADDERGLLRICRLEQNGGAARARNFGWRSTDAELVLFTDDDCRAAPDWARELASAMENGEMDIVQGRTRPDGRDPVPMGPWDRTLRISRWSGLFETCNIGYRRAVLEATGGFDETFPAGEDTDLGLRAMAEGARVSFAESAVVEHTIWRQDFRRYVRVRLRSVHLVPLVKRHPVLRRRLPLRIFWQRSHAKTAIGLAACVFAGVVHLAAPPVVIIVWILVKTRNVSGTWRHRLSLAGLRLVAGVTEVTVMAVVSVRHRSLLL